jgi:ribosome-binding protein aMBF1 (putative translation factor)
MQDDDEPESICCQICGSTESIVTCEGVDVCESCAKKHGSELAQFHDDMMDDLRGS